MELCLATPGVNQRPDEKPLEDLKHEVEEHQYPSTHHEYDE